MNQKDCHISCCTWVSLGQRSRNTFKLELWLHIAINSEVSTFYNRQNKALLKELSYPGPDTRDIQFPTRYAQSFWVQCLACLWKQHLSYWRNPYYSVVRFFFTTITAFIFGAIYWNRGKKTYVLLKFCCFIYNKQLYLSEVSCFQNFL